MYYNGEVYKLWVKEAGTDEQVVTTMEEVFPGYWAGRVETEFSLTNASILVTSEQEENITAPEGLGVAEKML